ncbi:hypothetical protein [Ketobacter sp. GenoA1]|uniref:hypothetical protein n=1 Tax=Ketobacter sp. GenoA1 TaxID=2072747 RepID=UPI000EBE300E|nr:hypothetical protein [Ketobacter sp. GenoA1]RLT89450.1 MAG: hypothetical protein D9N13_12080 [Ketobacter sp. GenoA1]HCB40397.1 hypothetical protein [Gammaproteobacteria bacterium]|tara:strand:+ start:2448 stop:2912 length:465 start_codon:yes stop_codon:yes gene_type:complete
MNAEKYVFELHGYLKALQRLCGTNYAFGARFYSKKEDLDTFGQKISEKKLKYEEADHVSIFKNIESMVFNGFLAKEHVPNERAWNYLTKVIIEDINEYFGLVSLALNEDGIFHPLLNGMIYKNIAPFEKDKASLIFWIEIEQHYVLAYFRNINR